MKKCIQCGLDKGENSFRKRGNSRRGVCRDCENIKIRDYYWREKSQYNQTLGIDKTHKKCFSCNFVLSKDSFDIWHPKTRCYKCKTELKKQRYKREYEKVKNNPIKFFASRVRSLISNGIGKNRKKSKTEKLLGCSLMEFRGHIESKFKEGMNWENYGRNGWHIDHITPIELFDLSTESSQKECFHYTNLQPLWESENISKSDYLGCGVRARNIVRKI